MKFGHALFRLLLCLSVLAGPASLSAVGEEAVPRGERPFKIAIIANFWSNRCHANVIATKFFTGFPTDDGLIPPKVKVASIYIDQPSPGDVGHKLAEKFGVPIYPSIAETLCLGGKKLAVDAVLYIGEHGQYPRSRFGVKMYPRLNHLEQVFRVFDASGRSVPVYCDKHLAYSWLDAKWIYDRAKELHVPMMAGSVMTLTWRRPWLHHPLGAKISEAVAVGYGPVDSYGFHALEILQCMVERRAGGETGVAAVRCLRGRAVYEAAKRGEFSMELAEAACAAAGARKGQSMEQVEKKPTAILIDYADGTKGVVLMLSRYIGEHWGYAAKVGGKTVACEFRSAPKPSYAYFSYLGLNIEKFFLTGKPQEPLERTLLTSGILDMAVRSMAAGGRRIETPFLNVKYQPFEFDPIWPASSEPRGASIGPWPPEGFEFTVPAKKKSPGRRRSPKNRTGG